MPSTGGTHVADAEKDRKQDSPYTPSTVITEDIIARNPKNRVPIDIDREAQISNPTRKKAATEGDGGGGDSHEYPSGLNLGLIIIALFLSIFLVILDVIIVATAIPKITDEFQRLDEVFWHGAAYSSIPNCRVPVTGWARYTGERGTLQAEQNLLLRVGTAGRSGSIDKM
ncbi:hypothetical protein IWW34DRAFT_895341 [Fusarium oxysporum f. sp. albedinis]|nr:hypothetical protein IWW34DRAFT_895341 [Fusarium oxysporum f. sp. albedinis]KAJ0128665.1 putative 37S ribosomal protein S18 [Fusarium oxysporum f. sp. albedinis]KAJ0129085.1 Acyl-CoA synthetase FUM16 [Fusarium oxysporum f. sp. albedinis]KAK2469202.1 hypothetical protein H9L39_19183 [Fusarium oxysporum f. sp. albedinis]